MLTIDIGWNVTYKQLTGSVGKQASLKQDRSPFPIADKELKMDHKRNVYLHMKSLADARRIVLDTFGAQPVPEPETLATTDAVGRVLAEAVVAALSSPNFHSAAMDGIAVAARSTFEAHTARPKLLALGSEAYYVNTGHVLPAGTDAVIMIEQVLAVDDGTVRIEAPAFPWQHVRKMGEDIVATELLFARHHRITPYCLGALLSAGIDEVSVLRRPRLVVIPTGSELVKWRKKEARQLKPGEIIESNGHMLSAMVVEAGGICERREPVGDDPVLISQTIAAAVRGPYDAVLTVGGSSAGSEDFTRSAIAEQGEVLVHGVTMMPGKPVLVGSVSGKPVFGIPGYPVSAIMAFEQLVLPLLAGWQGRPEPRREALPVIPTRKIASKLGVEEFVRVKLGRVGDRLVATALPRGAGQITSITEADGIVRIPADREGVGTETPVSAELLKPSQRIDRTVVVVGSHDNTLDLMRDELRAQSTDLSLSSSHVGSMGGLMAVKRGVCHVAGVHLLDENDGSYNRSYLEKYLPDIEVRLVHLVMRDQGLIVRAGNPKAIRGIEDLTRDPVRFVNRQSGSGTRILLDYRLRQVGIEPGRIDGYETEEFTHMAVAAAVLSGAADAGLGIWAAAKALGLEFIPIVTEQYDLVVPAVFYDTPAIQSLMSVINRTAFKQRVTALGGYHTERTGEVLL
jgi:putative molybdopterin biosynthesis protein